ncbi:MAG: hypothetical protein ACU84H_09075 [Gammaproteobacteria bacterium]
MAKNIIEQFLDYATSKLAGPIYPENIYREEASGLTGVEKYLARQEAAAMPQEAASLSGAATGVEKYLARQAALAGEQIQAAAAPAESAEPLTGVAKYLAGQGGAPVQAQAAVAAEEPKGPLSGVAKYLAGQGKVPVQAQAAVAAEEPKGPLSSVAKYLARQGKAPEQAQAAAAAEEPKAPLSGVAKYLAGQGRSAGTAASAQPESPLTRVAKYLAGFEDSAQSKTGAADPAPAPTTGVGKYLANKGGASAFKYQEPKIMTSAPDIEEEIAANAPVEAAAEAITMAEPAAVSSSEAEESNAPENPITTGSIILLDDGIRCQASTSKGSQCKITNGLSHIQRTIDEQTYQFSVCKQHDNEKFQPYPAMLNREGQ